MRVGQEIESIRKELGLSIVYMCDIFSVNEFEYNQIVKGKYKLTVFQLIMFISSVKKPLNSINK